MVFNPVKGYFIGICANAHAWFFTHRPLAYAGLHTAQYLVKLQVNATTQVKGWFYLHLNQKSHLSTWFYLLVRPITSKLRLTFFYNDLSKRLLINVSILIS